MGDDVTLGEIRILCFHVRRKFRFRIVVEGKEGYKLGFLG